ncbi:MAG: hypothetical protein ACC645_01075 [Pirellulales bacterium]
MSNSTGIFRSDDFGQSWVRIVNGITFPEDTDGLNNDEDQRETLNADGDIVDEVPILDVDDPQEGLQIVERIELAASPVNGSVFAAMVLRHPVDLDGNGNLDDDGDLAPDDLSDPVVRTIFRSTDQGDTWSAIPNLPDLSPGGQGWLHFSMLPHWSNPDILYLGGDTRGDPPFVGAIYEWNVVTGDSRWRGQQHRSPRRFTRHVLCVRRVGPGGPQPDHRIR